MAEFVDIPASDGSVLRITATPARHGPKGGIAGPVTGFLFDTVYVSGDTVWYEGVAEVVRRFRIQTATLFMGAARIREVGPAHVMMTAEEAVEAACAFPQASIVPLHFEGWAHFTESREDIERAFRKAGIGNRLRLAEAGQAIEVAA